MTMMAWSKAANDLGKINTGDLISSAHFCFISLMGFFSVVSFSGFFSDYAVVVAVMQCTGT